MKQYNLEELELVDALSEPAFDNLTKLASTLFDVPVSLFSVLQFENDRQYFKSKIGLEIVQTPLSHSFCQYVVSQNKPLVVEDSKKHPLVKTNLAIEKLNVQAYLGVPVYNPQGDPIASLCVIDNKPHRWTDKDIETLVALGKCATDAVRLKSETRKSEELLCEQQEFSFAITHDTTAPLVTVKCVLTNLVDEYQHSFSKETLRMCEVTKQTIDRAQKMIQDIANFNVTATSTLDRQVVDLNDLLRDTLTTHAGSIELSSATIVLKPLPTLLGNNLQLSMLFQNIIGNALKFQAPGNTPHITIDSEISDSKTIIRIRDNGIGIAPEENKKVFKLFSRLVSQREYEGSGVGLALAHRVVTNHGGQLDLHSDGTNGTCVMITLPPTAVFEQTAEATAA